MKVIFLLLVLVGAVNPVPVILHETGFWKQEAFERFWKVQPMIELRTRVLHLPHKPSGSPWRFQCPLWVSEQNILLQTTGLTLCQCYCCFASAQLIRTDMSLQPCTGKSQDALWGSMLFLWTQILIELQVFANEDAMYIRTETGLWDCQW